MTLRHLQIFRAVCENGSITAAAEKLNMTQPAVSIAVKELESFYGVRLFERLNRKIYLTDEGKTLLQYAETVLTQFDESVDALKSSDSFMRCRFGVNVTVGETKLSSLCGKIFSAFPEIDLRVFVDNTHIIEKMLINNDIDFAVVDNLVLSHNWKSDLLYSENMLLVCSPDFYRGNSITVNKLSSKKLLLRERGSGSRESADSVFLRHGCKPKPFFESSSSLALLNMAESGLGFTVLPSSTLENSLNSGKLKKVELSDDGFKRYHYLIRHEKKYLTKAMLGVIDIIQSDCQNKNV